MHNIRRQPGRSLGVGAKALGRTSALLTLLLACGGTSDTPSDSAAGAPRLTTASAAADTSALVLPASWPPMPSDRLVVQDTLWQFVYEAKPTKRLLIVRRIAVLTLPDGPFELLAPVTAVRQVNGVWTQLTPFAGTQPFPSLAFRALAPQLTQAEHVYFYRIRALDLSTRVDAADIAVSATRLMQEMEREATLLRKKGFIGGDAEP